MRASPSSAFPRASHSSSASHHLVFPDELAGSSDSISFGAPADDRMSIAASEDELGSGDDDSASMSRSSLDTDRFSALRSKGEHTSTRPSPSGYPCRLVSSPRS